MVRQWVGRVQGKRGRRAHSGRHVASSVVGRVITFWVSPRKENYFNQQKVQGGGLQFLIKRNKLHLYVFMYICIFPFSHWKPSNSKTSWFHKEMKCSIWVPLVRVTVTGTVNVCRS